jgi:hypothetical protein
MYRKRRQSREHVGPVSDMVAETRRSVCVLAGGIKKNAVRQDCVKSTPKDEGVGDIGTTAGNITRAISWGAARSFESLGRIMYLNPRVKQGFCALH